MKIGINEFLDIFYSVLSNDEVYSIELGDIIEIIKIMFSSNEFKIVSERININEFSEDNIYNHRYTEEIDSNYIVSFKVPEEEKEKIIKERMVDAGYIQQAINKRAISKCINIQTSGIANLEYDNPNMTYEMKSTDEIDLKGESVLYTDGECVDTILTKPYDNTFVRVIRIKDATFAIYAFYINNEVNRIEVRGTYNGDYTTLLYETKRILSHILDSYDEVISDSPKVYKYKRH